MTRFVPTHCVWETTLRCNLRCRHCGSRAGTRRGSELGTREALALIDDLAELGCERVVLSGGEPLLREDLAGLIRRIHARGMKPCLISNGYILSERIGALESLPLHSVAVSLDGLEETHDGLRQDPRSFTQALRSLRLLSRLFIDVYAVTQVNRLNYPDLEGLYALLCRLGIDGWQVQLTNDMGRAQDIAELMLDRAQIERLLGFILAKEGGPLKIYPGDDIGYHHRGRFRFEGCRGGISVVGIEADGGVKPCLSMQKGAGFLGGNIRQRPLREIWHDPGFAAVNRKEQALGGACAGCDHKRTCRGGCVGTAAAFDSLEEYPFCVRG